jgi:uncharacterized membrane protein (GlpM family)
VWKLDFSQLKQIKWSDFAIRFLFGGIVSVLAAFIAQLTDGRVGGIITAFPAILMASLTIINKLEGRHAAEETARGGIVGAVALVITTIVLVLTLGILSGLLSLLVALVVWLLCAIGLYAMSYKAQWLRVHKQ